MVLAELAAGLWVNVDRIAALRERPAEAYDRGRDRFAATGRPETVVYLDAHGEGSSWVIPAPVADVRARIAAATPRPAEPPAAP